MQVSEFLLRSLFDEGCRACFLLPGGTLDPFFEDLHKHAKLPQPIIVAHEACAVYMADAYARATGLFGVALAIGGPGVGNTTTAVEAANTDSIPLLLIGGHISTNKEDQGAFQDAHCPAVDDLKLMEPTARCVRRIGRAEEAAGDFKACLSAMLGYSRGPAVLIVPQDVQTEELPRDETHSLLVTDVLDELNRSVDAIGINDLKELVAGLAPHAVRIAILAGDGVRQVGGGEALRKFAEDYHVPVATSLSAKGVVYETHEFSLGVAGYAGSERANKVLLDDSIDVLLVLGCMLDERTTWGWSNKFNPLFIVQVDWNESVRTLNFMPDVFIRGSTSAFLAAATKEITIRNCLADTKSARTIWFRNLMAQVPSPFEEPSAACTDELPLHPARVVTSLRNATRGSPVNIVVDSGAHRVFMGHFWQCEPGDHYFTSAIMAPMGWAIAAGIGVALGRPDAITLVVTGDGCMLMHGTEIVTARRYGLKVLYVVFNNGCYSNPKSRYKNNPEVANGFDLPTCDFAKLGIALGIPSVRACTAEEVYQAVRNAAHVDGPSLIDVDCQHCTPPTARYKREASARNARKS